MPLMHIPCHKYWCGPLRNRDGTRAAGLFHHKDGSDTCSSAGSDVGGDEIEFYYNKSYPDEYLECNYNHFQMRVGEERILKLPLFPNEPGFKSGLKRCRINKSAPQLTSNGFLNPECLRDLHDCDSISQLREVLGLAPNADIEARIERALNDHGVLLSLTRLDAVPDDAQESQVEMAFSYLVSRIIDLLKSSCEFSGKRINFSVGGILADESCAVSGVTDYVALNEKKEIAFATECKTMYAHPLEELFYKGSKGYQLFGAFFGSGCKPTFLYTQKHFILLVRDQSSSRTFKYPPGNAKFMVDSLNFLEAVAICLLSSSQEIRKDKLFSPRRNSVPLKATEQSTLEKLKENKSRSDSGSMKPKALNLERGSAGRKRKGESKGGNGGGLKLTAENLLRMGESFKKNEDFDI